MGLVLTCQACDKYVMQLLKSNIFYYRNKSTSTMGVCSVIFIVLEKLEINLSVPQ